MKSRKVLLGVLVVMSFALGGCASNKIKDGDDAASKSLVFGYVDMDDAPVGLGWVTIRQVLPKSDKPYWYEATDDGMFWNSHHTTGAYQFSSFGGHRMFGNVDYTFELPRQYAEQLRVKIDKPGIYFLGSYKYVKVKTGFFEQEKFDFAPVKSPTERELLERLLKDYTRGPEWEARIKRRIAELSK